ncbi:alpha-galactosidase [Enterococcus sp. 669A]|uniref:Alpha-galactosidase n=2 Tax=Candidatus Enterococcus moelleringii TaxID=2815325 RepID=A0ABS3LBG0_9ENTE|nr:alpha-galactosidase [Enterococcus sp. 669A]MBO1306076.1 alpha-galactosidase [Enterococcus sp. 669A]
MEIVEETYLIHRYWGKKLTSYHFSNRPTLKKRTFAAAPNNEKPEISPEFLPFELPFAHQGDFRSPALQIEQKNCETITRFSYQGYEIVDGAPELTDLPHARNTEEQAQTLIVYLFDEIAQIEVALYYTIFAESSVIVRSTSVKNAGSETVKVTKLLSASLDTRYDGQVSTTFYGTHQKEFQLNRQEIQHGMFKIGSSRGASSPQYPPYLALSKDANEFQGEVHAMTLIYSGNHETALELDQYNHLRLQIGLNSETFAWQLHSGETLQSPQAVLSYSDLGFNGSSQSFHQFFTDHLIHPAWKNKARPVLINSWEMTYYDVNEALIKQLIDSASELGFETVVLDDGWYSKRNSSKTSLGDWAVDGEKFPNGIKPLVEYAKEKGLGFGIWFEPEMISPNTKLIQQHPDWVMRSANYEPILGRSQLVLDLTNPDVQQFIIHTLSQAIEDFGVNYVKWDMNRHLTDPFSQRGDFPAFEYGHRYMLGLYRIIDALTSTYPEVLFENCSSGGGRLDVGMLYYFPQTWISDNTDGLDRQEIQSGASNLFPISSMTGHVSDVPNHQTNRTVPFETRAALASSTNMGYEMDIIHLNEAEKEMIRQHLQTYKAERELIMQGQFYRLLSPFEGNLCAWLFTDKAQEQAIVYVFRNRYQVFDLSLLVKIPYLDEDGMYQIVGTDQVYSGSELAHCGLALDNKKGDFAVQKITLKKMESE